MCSHNLQGGDPKGLGFRVQSRHTFKHGLFQNLGFRVLRDTRLVEKGMEHLKKDSLGSDLNPKVKSR